MSQNNVIDLKNPEPFINDPITDILRQGARRLLTAALEAEINLFLNQYKKITDNKGNQRVVRNGYLPERSLQTGIGGVPVKVPRVRDRADESSDKVKFESTLVPRYLRRSRSLDELLPALYLRGISTGNFTEALTALLGEELCRPGLI